MNENVLEIRIEDNSPAAQRPADGSGPAPPPGPPRPPVPPAASSRPQPPVAASAGGETGGPPPAAGPGRADDLRDNPNLDALFNGTPPPPLPPPPPPGPPEPPPDDDGRAAKLLARARERVVREKEARRLERDADTARTAGERAARESAGEKRGASAAELDYVKSARGENPDQARRADREAKAAARAETDRLRGERDDAKKVKAEQRDTRDQFRTVSGAAQQMSSGKPSDLVSGGMQVAGTGLLGAEAAALAAGPVGAAVVAAPVIADAVGRLMAKPFERAKDGVEALGAAARDVAGNDGIGLFKKGTAAAADGLEALGPGLYVAAAQVRLAGAAVATFQETVTAFVARGRELAAYDARLAGANATADVRGLQRDIREAERTGEALARLTDAQSRLDANFSEAILPVKMLLIDLLTAIAEPVAAASDFYVEVKPMLPSLKAVLQALFPTALAASKFFEVVQEAAAKANRVVDRILDPLGLKQEDREREQAAEKAKLNTIMQGILDFGGSLGPISGAGSQRAAETNGGFGFPMLQ